MKAKRKLSIVKLPEPIVRDGPMTRAEKLQAAITYLGERWSLHPKFDKKNLRVGILNSWRDSQPKCRP